MQHELLAHLARQGFAGVPQFLGIDSVGREMLTYLPGDVLHDSDGFTDAQLGAAGALLRRFHDATSDFPAVVESGAEVMCHNDWTPANAVFTDGLPYALIDFDTARPGARLWDVSYSAWTWLDFGDPGYTGDEQLRRLEVFLSAYSHPSCDPSKVVVFALARQAATARWARASGNEEGAKWAARSAEWTLINLTERLHPTGLPSLPIAGANAPRPSEA